MSQPETVNYLNGEVPVVAGQPNGGHPEVHEFTGEAATTNGADGQSTIKADVLVIGAGFSGITAMHRFRKEGMTVKCFESGEDFGGVWYWNRSAETGSSKRDKY